MAHMLAHLAASLLNRPLAIRPEKAEIIMAALADRLGIASLRLPDGRLRAFDDDGSVTIDASDIGAWDRDEKGYQVVAGVAVIDVLGTLVQRQMGLRPMSGMTGYSAVRANLFAALDDPQARAIALDIDSPGGDVAGLFDLADAIFAARGQKPIWAILDETAASAAYAIAAACNKVTVPRTGYAGSIGVIVLHADVSRLLDKEGITVTILQFGARKADGQAAIPLSDPARTALQADVDTVGQLFVDSVARYRGISASRVRAQEATVFMGERAAAAGLADVVASPADAFQMLCRSLTSGRARRPMLRPAQPASVPLTGARRARRAEIARKAAVKRWSRE
jgi:capsid assembly protease